MGRWTVSLACWLLLLVLWGYSVQADSSWTVAKNSVNKNNNNNNNNIPQQWTVQELPKRQFQASRHLRLSTSGDEGASEAWHEMELGPDQVLVKVEAFAIDAFLRTLLEPDSFHWSLQVGEPMRASGYGTVLKAGSNQAYKVGSRVIGMLPVANVAVVDKSPFLRNMRSIPGIRPSLYLGLLGTSGLSAYVGIFLASPQPPRKGETVVISAAAGGVGTCAAQMARLTGARVVGIAGGAHKVDFLLNELGLDAAIDYKHPTKSLDEQLEEACPDGVDFFLDNVGGETLDVLLNRINQGARVVICGAISRYDTGSMYSKPQGPRNYLKLAERSATMSGFVVSHYLGSFKNMLAAISYILWHYTRGNLKSFEHVEKGIECFGPSLEKLLNGKHMGRLLVDVTGDL